MVSYSAFTSRNAFIVSIHGNRNIQRSYRWPSPRRPKTAEERRIPMSVLNRIAYFQNRRDEEPNQELAKDLAAIRDRNGIQKIAENLWNKNQNVQSDCLKVLYEIGYLDPVLISDYVGDFLKLLNSMNNHLVWGSMIALSIVAKLKADAIYDHRESIQATME